VLRIDWRMLPPAPKNSIPALARTCSGCGIKELDDNGWQSAGSSLEIAGH